MKIRCVEFEVVTDADFEKKLQQAVEQHKIPVENIITVTRRNTSDDEQAHVMFHARKEHWLIIWREPKTEA